MISKGILQDKIRDKYLNIKQCQSRSSGVMAKCYDDLNSNSIKQVKWDLRNQYLIHKNESGYILEDILWLLRNCFNVLKEDLYEAVH